MKKNLFTNNFLADFFEISYKSKSQQKFRCFHIKSMEQN